MTTIDALIFAIILMAFALIALAAYAWQQRQRASSQQQRGDENWMWAELHRQEADAARERRHVMERRYATLQSLYANLVRQRLAENFTLIERNVAWKRQRRRK